MSHLYHSRFEVGLSGEIKKGVLIFCTLNTDWNQTARMCGSEPQLMFMNAAMELYFSFLLSP